VVNPWINYPYATNQLMKDAADSCHAFGMKFKIYNTMRELSNRCRELWAMRAFQETYVKGPDPNPDASDWLQEHLGGDFEKAWSNPMQVKTPCSLSPGLIDADQYQFVDRLRSTNLSISGGVRSKMQLSKSRRSVAGTTTMSKALARCSEILTTTVYI
jgi:hypothetical protein